MSHPVAGDKNQVGSYEVREVAERHGVFIVPSVSLEIARAVLEAAVASGLYRYQGGLGFDVEDVL